MPLYADSNFYYSGGSSQLFSPYYPGSTTTSIYNPYSTTPYNRPYTGSYVIPLTSTRSNNYGGHGLSSLRYQPKLSTITESSPLTSSALHTNLMPLTRIQSPKYNPYTTHSPVHTSKYVPPRPILINTADIDVSTNRYRKRKQAEIEERHRQRCMESASPRTSIKTNTNPTTTITNNNVELSKKPADEEQRKECSIIRRNRTVVRLSTVRSRDRDRAILNEKKPEEFYPITTNENIQESVKSQNESLPINDKVKGEIDEIPVKVDNELIPTFHDICEDISSDKIDDDLNAGELRRRASLICCQDQEILSHLQNLERRNSHENLENAPKRRQSIKDKNSNNKVTSIGKGVGLLVMPKPAEECPDIQATVKVLPNKTVKKLGKSKEQESNGAGKKLSPKKKPMALKKKSGPDFFTFDENSIKAITKESALVLPKEISLPKATENQTTMQDIPAQYTECNVPSSSGPESIHFTTKIKNVENKPVPKPSLKWNQKVSASVDLPDLPTKQISLKKSQSFAAAKTSSAVVAPKSLQPHLATPKPIKKSDSGDDFWAQIGTRETVYMTHRKKTFLENSDTKNEKLTEPTADKVVEMSKATNLSLDETNKQAGLLSKPVNDTVDTDLRKHLLEKSVKKKINNHPQLTRANTTDLNFAQTALKSITADSKEKKAKESTDSTSVLKISESSAELPQTSIDPNDNKTELVKKSTALNIDLTSNKNTLQNINQPKVTLDLKATNNKLDKSKTPAKSQMSSDCSESIPEKTTTATIITSKITGHSAKSPEQKQPNTQNSKHSITSEAENDKCKASNNNRATVETLKQINVQEEGAAATTIAATKQPETLSKKLLENAKCNEVHTAGNDIQKTSTTTTTATTKTKAKPGKSTSPVKAKAKTSPSVINAEQFVTKAPNKVLASPTKSTTTTTSPPIATTPTALSTTTTTTTAKVNTKSIDSLANKTSSPDKPNTVLTTSTDAITISAATTIENKSGIRDINNIKDGSNNNLSKFATVTNLAQCLRDVDADLEDYVSSSAEISEDDSDLDLSSIDGWDSFSASMKKKLKERRKKEKQAEQDRFDPQKKVKIDTTRKLYVKEEAPRYPLVATPRPLWKREKNYYDDIDSDESDNEDSGSTEETETSDDSEEYEDDLPAPKPDNDNNKTDPAIIRMSTSSNDSGFEGGTAPASPKRMLECDVNCHKKCERLTANLCGVNQKLIVEALASVKRGARDTRDSPSTPPSLNPAYKIESYEEQNETSYTYAQFQKSGRFTSPATVIPRFKNYSVDDFHFLAVLGKGSFGKVLLAELRDTTYYYAIKCLKKDVVLEDDDVDSTLIERKVLALGTKHPYLCHLFCTFQTESHLFFVMEYLNGGDLMFHIQESGRFPEERARFYGAEIISGLKFLHKKGIIYRDLKLDNVLLDYEGHVRIADFGMCKLQIYLDKTADSFCGTPDYMAPEIIKAEKYNQNVDWWSFGVLLYEMLIGQSPFSGCDEDELFWSICNEIPWFPVYITTEATSILKGLLEKDHNKRIGSHYSLAGDICDHVFFRPIDWDLLEKRLIPPPFRPQVKHPLDTQYFDRIFTRERVRLTPIDKDILQSMDQKQFLGFTYTNPHITLD